MNTANYFLPSLRRGYAAAIEQSAGTSQRTQIDVELHLRARRMGQDSFDTDTVTKSLHIYGPGDVLGFKPSIVTKTYPEPNVDDWESNHFPAVEFEQADFAWRYTPDTAKPNGSLQPWVTLVVLVEQDRDENVTKEFLEGERNLQHPIPWIHVLSQQSLPDLTYAWRWAHVCVADAAESLGEAELLNLFENEPERAICRLLCPRRLHSKTQYSAFIVPTFELSRLAALHEPKTGIARADTPAWSSQSPEPIDLPYYYRWKFRTREGGDFEELVRRLQPRVLTNVGTRRLDASAPGFGITGEEITMEGALRPLSLPASLGASSETKNAIATLLRRNASTTEHNYFIRVGLPATSDVDELELDVLRDGRSVRIGFSTKKACTSRVDYGKRYAYDQTTERAGYRTDHSLTLTNLEPLHRYHFMVTAVARDGTVYNTTDGQFTMPERLWVTPPIYGRWHKGDAELNADAPESWLDSLNLEPMHRVAAGLGATVVRKNQEDLMASAWEQLGRVDEANEILRHAQFGVEISKNFHRRLSRMDLDTVLHITAPVQTHILAESSTTQTATITKHIDEKSFVPRIALQPALRRLTKPRGAIRRRQGVNRSQPISTATSAGILERLATKELEAAGPHPIPGGTPSFGKVTEAFLVANSYVEGVRRSEQHDEPVVEKFDESQFAPVWLDPVINETENPFSGGEQISTQEAENLVTKAPNIAFDVSEVMEKWLNKTQPDPANPNNTRASQNRNFLVQIRNTVLDALRPEQTIVRRAQLRLGLSQTQLRNLSSKDSEADTLDGIMAAPEFSQPMYEPLQEMSQEFLLPGVSKIPPNTLTLVESNQVFIESYLVGCNHEFASELLWRRYPSDQRGSYFRQFWDVSEYIPKPNEVTNSGELSETVRNRLRNISEIHTWGDRALGDNLSEQQNGGHELFLLIRGDLLRRYPSTVIYAVEAVPKSPRSSEFVPGLPEYVTGYSNQISYQGKVITPIYPDFKGSLQPDIIFLGFQLPEGMDILAAVDTGSGGGHGLFFVLEERFNEVCFGLDVSAPEYFQTWRDLSWEHFKFVPDEAAGRYIDSGQLVLHPTDDAGRTWNEDTNSATLAYITLQNPVRVAVHASQMIHRDYLP